MKTIITRLATAGILLLTAQFALAAPMVYYDKATFLADNPGLKYEGFDFLGDPGILGCSGASELNSTTSSSCWAAGDAIPGYTISADPSSGDPPLVAVGPSAGFGNSETAILANFFVDAFKMVFDGGADAIGFDWVDLLAGEFMYIDVWLLDGTYLLSDMVSGLEGFWGISGYGLIGQINLYDPFGGAEGVSNLWFGRTAVPEPGTLALLGLGLFGMGLSRRRKKA